MARDWNELDHDEINTYISDMTCNEQEYHAACEIAANIWDGEMSEVELATAAVRQLLSPKV